MAKANCIIVLGNGSADSELTERRRNILFGGKYEAPMMGESAHEGVCRAVDWLRHLRSRGMQVHCLVFTSGYRSGYYKESLAGLMEQKSLPELKLLPEGKKVARLVNRCPSICGFISEMRWAYRQVRKQYPDADIWVVARGFNVLYVQVLSFFWPRLRVRMVPEDIPAGSADFLDDGEEDALRA